MTSSHHTLTAQYFNFKGKVVCTVSIPVFLDTCAVGCEPSYASADGNVKLYDEENDLDVRGMPGGLAHFELDDPKGYLIWSSDVGWTL